MITGCNYRIKEPNLFIFAPFLYHGFNVVFLPDKRYLFNGTSLLILMHRMRSFLGQTQLKSNRDFNLYYWWPSGPPLYSICFKEPFALILPNFLTSNLKFNCSVFNSYYWLVQYNHVSDAIAAI